MAHAGAVTASWEEEEVPTSRHKTNRAARSIGRLFIMERAARLLRAYVRRARTRASLKFGGQD